MLPPSPEGSNYHIENLKFHIWYHFSVVTNPYKDYCNNKILLCKNISTMKVDYNSIVGIASHYRMDDSVFTVGDENFCSHPDQPGAHPPLCMLGTGACSRGKAAMVWR